VLITPNLCAGRLFEPLSGAAPLVEAEAGRAYAKSATERFDERLAKERGAQR